VAKHHLMVVMVVALQVHQLLKLFVHACQLYMVKDTFQTGKGSVLFSGPLNG
jgi:endonuclease/exonuclease/phosphatase (EEP) superfamily protein YafD